MKQLKKLFVFLLVIIQCVPTIPVHADGLDKIQRAYLESFAVLANGNTKPSESGCLGAAADDDLTVSLNAITTKDELKSIPEVSKGILIVALAMSCEPWSGSSELVKNVGLNNIREVMRENLEGGSKDIDPKDVSKDDLKEELSGTGNATMDDYGSTFYSRLTLALSLTSATHNTNDYTDEYSKFASNRKKINWGIQNYAVLNNTPIMLDNSITDWKVDPQRMSRLSEVNAIVGEMGAYATVWASKHSNADELNDANIRVLKSIHKAVEKYRDIIPALQTAWEYGNPSLKDLYNKAVGEDDSENNNVVNDSDGVDEADINLIDHPQPLTNFFTINTFGTNAAGINDPWDWFSSSSITTSSVSDPNLGAAAPVVFSDDIKTGIAESASYVPMMTNVYHRDVLNAIDDSDFKKNFHYKYGFMRKALYLEKSSTSVQTFYTTKGKTRGQLQVCTLQDLLDYASIGSEVTLWIDDNFYNAEQLQSLIEEVDSDQKTRIEKSTAYGTTAYQETYNSTALSPEATQVETQNGTQSASKEEAMDQFLLYSGLTNLDTSNKERFLKVINELANATGTSIQVTDEALKSGDFTSYSASLRSNLTKLNSTLLVGGDYTDADSPTYEINNFDDYIMSSYYIKKYLSGMTTRDEVSTTDQTLGYRYTTYNPYTPLLSYAWTSAIYRDRAAFSLFQNCSSYSPVFMASDKIDPTSLKDESVSPTLMNSVFNYALLKNLVSMSQISYQHTLDLRSPLYIDIYGNILTSSGTVVIPAASNATLWASDWNEVQPALGLYTCYGKNYSLPISVENPQLEAMWSRGEKYWMPYGREVSTEGGSETLDYSNVDSYDTGAQEVAKINMYNYLQNDSKINWWAYASIISEVMRGAPVESIDVTKEGLSNVNKDIDGMVLASKLEDLQDSLESSVHTNSLLMIPDFSRMENLEFVFVFIIKILAILTIFVVLLLIYQDGAANELGFRTILRTMFCVFLTFMSVTMIPAIFQFTYYGANRLLLQREADRIVMFRTEKYNSGVEVGVLDTRVPTTNNDVMIKLDYVDVPWYNYISQVVFGSSITNLTDLKLQRYAESPVAYQENVQMFNDGAYMSVTDILNSVNMDYTFGNDVFVANTEGEGLMTNLGDGYDKNIYLQNTAKNQTFSYYSPYYAFLRCIVTNINDYNAQTGEYSYTTKYMSGMKPKTVGLCDNYFTSPVFMEDSVDIFRLHEIYDMVPSEYTEIAGGHLKLTPSINPFDDQVFSSSDIETMKKSLWYSMDTSSRSMNLRIRAMDKWARDYIARNQDVISKISDETFIKVFCLSAALKYNQLYGVSEANVYEIYNIDTADLMRLAVAETSDAMQSSPMSYSRYLYTYGGAPSVYAGAMLAMIMWFGSYFKPLCTVLVFLSVFVSIFVNKILLRRMGSFLGYVITGVLISAVNIVHALILKMCCFIPTFHLPTFVCILLMMIIQVLYIALLAMITWICLREWRDMGEAHYRAQLQKVKWQKTGAGAQALKTNVVYHRNNSEYYDDLVRAYRRRSGAPGDDE